MQSSELFQQYNQGFRVAASKQTFKPNVEFVKGQFPFCLSSRKMDWDKSIPPLCLHSPGPQLLSHPGEVYDSLFGKEVVAEFCDLLSKHLQFRQLFLESLNILQAAKAQALIASSQETKKAHLTHAKLALKTLMSVTVLFHEDSLSLRRQTLERYEPHNPDIIRLLRSTPFSASLFGTSEVAAALRGPVQASVSNARP